MTDEAQATETKEHDLINDLLNGDGLSFEVDGATFYIAQPTTEEYDDATFIQRLAYERAMALPEMEELLDVPATEGAIVSWQNKADQIASNQALLVRDRWLSIRLICDEDGERMFSPDDAESVTKWDKLPMRVKETARKMIWSMLAVINSVPFGWEQPDAPKSD